MSNSYSYRSYMIRHNALNGLWWIEKGGAFITNATDRTDAMRIIDALLEDERPIGSRVTYHGWLDRRP